MVYPFFEDADVRRNTSSCLAASVGVIPRPIFERWKCAEESGIWPKITKYLRLDLHQLELRLVYYSLILPCANRWCEEGFGGG